MSIATTNLSGDPGKNLIPAPGGPNIPRISNTNQEVLNAQINNNYTVVEGANQGTNEFPYRAFLLDTYDSIAAIKNQVSGGHYKVEFDSADVDYVIRQRAQVENADYDRWVMQKYDLSNPAQNLMLQKIDPDQHNRRMDLLKYNLDLEAKYAELRVAGPKSEEDLKFEWLIETGRIEMPEGPIWDPQRWMANQMLHYQRHDAAYSANAQTRAQQKSEANRQRMKNGLYNPVVMPNEDQTGWQANRDNYSDIRGLSDRPTWGQVFGGSMRPVYPNYGQNPIPTATLFYQQPNTAHLRFGVGQMGAAAVAALGNRPPRFAAAGANTYGNRIAAYRASNNGYGIQKTQT